MKKLKVKIFLRSFCLTAVIIFCFSFLTFGTAKAYKGIREIGFGDYRAAFEFKEGRLKILDFEINLFETFLEKEI